MQFVTDIYVAFLNRMPDASGVTYWTGLLGSGLPRNVVLNSFLFGPEFSATMQVAVRHRRRPQRGLHDRGPVWWNVAAPAGRCRIHLLADAIPRRAVLRAPPAVYASVNSITQQFLGSAEYLARNRTNSEYVQDLYYAFLRRGGDLAGFNYWVALLNTGSSRESCASSSWRVAEMQGRIAQIAGETCLP